MALVVDPLNSEGFNLGNIFFCSMLAEQLISLKKERTAGLKITSDL